MGESRRLKDICRPNRHRRGHFARVARLVVSIALGLAQPLAAGAQGIPSPPTAPLAAGAAPGPLAPSPIAPSPIAPAPQAPAVGPPAAGGAAGGPAPVYTRQTTFAIPFQIDRAQADAVKPTAVQLQVSEDQGTTWQTFQEVAPAANKFTFRAPHDGQFWFAVRTVNAQGQLQPPGVSKPELCVVVDTLAPRLELSADYAVAGDIVVKWRILDQHLKPDTFRLEYKAADAPTSWQPVSTPPPAKGHATIEENEISFWPGVTTRAILVRAQVSDTAGNPAVSQVRVEPDVAPSDKPDGPIHAASTGGGKPTPSKPKPSGTSWATDDWSESPLLGGTAAEAVAPPPPSEAIGPLGESVAAEAVAPAPATSGEAIGPGQPTPTGPELGSTAGGPGVFGTSAGDNSVAPMRVDDEIDPVAPSNNTAPVGDAIAPHTQVQWINSRRLELDYDVDASAAGSIDKIELWGTTDSGRSWSSFGVDSDQRSPVAIDLTREGLYGFRIVVETRNGLGGLPPRPGDPAELWIAVDLTPPQARLLPIAPPESGHAGEIVIRWEAQDANLSERPIALSFAETPQGPWNHIVTDLANTGEWVWRVDRRLPERVFLRLEARDLAGNRTAVVTSDPLPLDSIRPRGRIRGVHPARGAQRPAPARPRR